MTEFMGNISGTYDAKEKGFCPGASSLHSCMSGHGPDAEVFDKASNADLKPFKTGEDSLAFMFETTFMLKLTDRTMQTPERDLEYQ
jgi:homogentisate 1,2-dioxygenase